VAEYDDLLEEAKTKAAAYISTAKVYIPKMYNALMNESKNISPEDARDRIGKDCFGIWSKRTILDALPDEAKNREKQESGRLGQKKRNFAAVSAAPEARTPEIILDTHGRSTDGGSTIDESSQHRSKDQIKAKECPNCQELNAANQESKDAVEKSNTSSTPNRIGTPHKELIRFEFYAPFKPLLQHMATASNSDWSVKKICFVGVLDTHTGILLDLHIGARLKK
jgi:hypothetical protein